MRRQQKQEQKAVDDLFRNKMPAPPVTADGADAAKEAGARDVAGAGTGGPQKLTAGETWFFALGQVVLDFLLSVLRALGLLRTDPRTDKTASS